MKKWILKAIFILIILSLIGCSAPNVQTTKLIDVSNTLAEVEITSIGYASGLDTIEFDVAITPKIITYNQKYFVALISQDNYLYKYNSILPWTQEDFAATNNVNRKLRNVALIAPSSDKDIRPIIQSYVELRQQRHPNGITKADYQNLCRNHVLFVVMDENTLQSLITQQSPTSSASSTTIPTTQKPAQTLPTWVFTTPPTPFFLLWQLLG
jgi:hypothetical protein